MKKLITLIILLLLNIALYGAENGKSEKSNEKQSKLKLYLRQPIQSMKFYKEHAAVGSCRLPRLLQCYAPLDDNEPLITVDLVSNGDDLIGTYDLPVLKPLGQSALKIQAAIESAFFLPQGIPTIISKYADNQLSLLDVTEGQTIEILLPHYRGPLQAEVTCHGSYKNWDLQLRRTLIDAHKKNIIKLEKLILERIQKEIESQDPL